MTPHGSCGRLSERPDLRRLPREERRGVVHLDGPYLTVDSKGQSANRSCLPQGWD
jgi:hypothetical protein